MMKQMRENTKIILWIVVVAFIITIFAVWGMDLQMGDAGGPGQQNVLGTVNGVKITRSQFQAVYEQIASQYRAASPEGRLDYAQQEMVLDDAWENIVVTILTNEQIKKLGIEVSDQEIVTFLRTSPPPEIRQYFLNEQGNFDFAAYQNALNNPDADWTGVENLARQRIPMMKLNQYLMAQVHVSATEVEKAFEEETVKMTVDYVRFPIGEENIDDYSPSDEEISAYHSANPDRFREDERAVIDYVRIPIEPTPRDVDDVVLTVRDLRDQIIGGEDFAVMANTFSEAPTAAVGGETGFLTRDQRDSKVMDALSKLEPGSMSEPILTDDRVYLLKLLETKDEGGETRYNFQEIYLKLTAGSMTMDSLYTLARDIHQDAVDSDLRQAAEGKGLSVATTEPFARNMPIEGIGFVPSFSRFAFNNEVGALSNIISDDRAYYICRLVKRIPEGVKPLESVRAEIIAALRVDRQKGMAQRKADAFTRKVTTTRSTFREAADSYGYAVQRSDSFTVAGGTMGILPYSPFAYAAINLVDDACSRPIESGDSYYVMQLLGRTDINPDDLQARASLIASRIHQEKVQAYVVYWYDRLKAESKIEDYRNSF